jgi:hypothetical protein
VNFAVLLFSSKSAMENLHDGQTFAAVETGVAHLGQASCAGAVPEVATGFPAVEPAVDAGGTLAC